MLVLQEVAVLLITFGMEEDDDHYDHLPLRLVDVEIAAVEIRCLACSDTANDDCCRRRGR
ncbi:hypothetical protein [Streptosporangium sp. OZ121]|uniref:hypothetical protein n=1 Tax=Streptosporangium sp. OZ121 TaxID=3444183 RepID=UPI003F78C7D0